MRESRRQERFIASLPLESEQGQVGAALRDILLKKKKKDIKVRCKFCLESITRSNMTRHVKQAHTWCTYCNKIHSLKVPSLVTECPMFQRFWKMVYVEPF